MSIVSAINLARLGGFTGSNPEILAIYPNRTLDENETKSIIDNSLPLGVAPNTFSLIKIDDNYYLSYIFSICGKEANCRDDLASISIIIDDKMVKIEDFKVLFQYIIQELILSTKVIITTEFLIESMEIIFDGINKMKKITIGNLIIDIPKIIKKEKLAIVKEKNIKGRFS